ncbi:MAG: RNA 2',3'-cyclic phosphodiesterase [Bacillota bacterium]|nr:RNA 2',3'-cyclic phosphodiesterase [Bacillota bacterium]
MNSPGNGVLRLFIAVDLSDKQKHEVLNMQHRASEYLEGIKWVKPEGMHLTLKFIGETEEHKITEIKSAMDKAFMNYEPIETVFGGCGVFPNLSRARIFWVDVSRGKEALNRLASSIDSELILYGFEPEKRDYRPHLTIGRARYPLPDKLVKIFLEQEEYFESPPNNICEVILYQSRLTKHGAVYNRLYSSQLGE